MGSISLRLAIYTTLSPAISTIPSLFFHLFNLSLLLRCSNLRSPPTPELASNPFLKPVRFNSPGGVRGLECQLEVLNVMKAVLIVFVRYRAILEDIKGIGELFRIRFR